MGITDVAGIIADSIRGDEEAGEPSNPNDGVAGDQGPVKNQPPDRRATASTLAISGSRSRMSGPWSRPVSARRSGRNKARPLAHVATSPPPVLAHSSDTGRVGKRCVR